LENELNQRIGTASGIQKAIDRSIITKRELSTKAKVSVYNTVYVPTLTYGHESWTMTKRMHSRIQASEMRFLRKIAGKRRIDKIRNEEIRKQVGVSELRNKLESSQLRWYGHVVRMSDNRLPKQILNSGTENMGKRPRGRPKLRWHDQIREMCVSKLGINKEEIQTIAQDRDIWKRTITCNPTPQ